MGALGRFKKNLPQFFLKGKKYASGYQELDFYAILHIFAFYDFFFGKNRK